MHGGTAARPPLSIAPPRARVCLSFVVSRPIALVHSTCNPFALTSALTRSKSFDRPAGWLARGSACIAISLQRSRALARAEMQRESGHTLKWDDSCMCTKEIDEKKARTLACAAQRARARASRMTDAAEAAIASSQRRRWRLRDSVALIASLHSSADWRPPPFSWPAR